MDPIKFRIYERSDKHLLSTRLVILSILGSTIGAFLISTMLFNNDYGKFETTLLWISTLTMFFSAILFFIRQTQKMPLNGKLMGYLEFHINKIVIST